MSEKISLAKREDTLKISLKKASVPENLILRVATALDISGSMAGLYRSGAVSEFVGKLLPFGMLFDDNEQIDMWAFDHGVQELPPAIAKVYDDYVGKCMSGISINGGTAYGPVMKEIYEEYFPSKQTHTIKTEVVYETKQKSGFLNKLFGKTEVVETVNSIRVPLANSDLDTTPAMVFFLTDGENGDPQVVRRLLEENKNTPVYWFMVGLGNSSFSFLKEIAKDYPNVDFISIDDLQLQDGALYDKLLSKEFGKWAKGMGVANA